MKFKGRWHWCGHCDVPVITCHHCENSSCNGGGCDKCKEDFDEAIRMINEGTAPKKEDVPHTIDQIRDMVRKERFEEGWSIQQIEAEFRKIDEVNKSLGI